MPHARRCSFAGFYMSKILRVLLDGLREGAAGMLTRTGSPFRSKSRGLYVRVPRRCWIDRDQRSMAVRRAITRARRVPLRIGVEGLDVRIRHYSCNFKASWQLLPGYRAEHPSPSNVARVPSTAGRTGTGSADDKANADSVGAPPPTRRKT
jgi:hypothetical protein